MKLHDLKPRRGSRKGRKRVGRGISAGQGKTAGRGTKGEGARAGSGGKIYRQGGNLPFFRRLPFKRGFTNLFRQQWNEVNLEQLEGIKAGTEVTPEILAEAGLLRDPEKPVAILGRGEVSAAIKVHAHRFTISARSKIEGAGGEAHLLPLEVVEEEPYNVITVGDLRDFDAESIVTPTELAAAGLLADPAKPVALQGRGRVKVPLTVKVHFATRSARSRILSAGGTLEIVEAA